MCNSRSPQNSQDDPATSWSWRSWRSLLNLCLASYLIIRILGSLSATNRNAPKEIRYQDDSPPESYREHSREPYQRKDEKFLKPLLFPPSSPPRSMPLKPPFSTPDSHPNRKSALAQAEMSQRVSIESEIR